MIPVAVEIELATNPCTNKLKRRTDVPSIPKKKKRKPNIKKKGRPLLTVIEQGKVSEIDMTKIMDCVY